MERRLIEVVWNDAWSDQENFATAHGIAQNHQPMVVRTLGWLIHEDEVGISVAPERSMDANGETFRGRTFIPRGMILTVTTYKLTKPRAKRKPPAEP